MRGLRHGNWTAYPRESQASSDRPGRGRGRWAGPHARRRKVRPAAPRLSSGPLCSRCACVAVQGGGDCSPSRVGCLRSARMDPSTLQTGRRARPSPASARAARAAEPGGPLTRHTSLAEARSGGGPSGRSLIRQFWLLPTRSPASQRSPLAASRGAPRGHQSSFAPPYKEWRDASWPKWCSAGEASLP